MSKKILVVDDERDVVEFQKAYLSRRGYSVSTASNVTEAIETIKKETPDIVFCDVRFESGGSGLDILAPAKAIKPDIVVYLISGLVDQGIEDAGIALGAKEVLSKPISNADFEKKIREALV